MELEDLLVEIERFLLRSEMSYNNTVGELVHEMYEEMGKSK